MKAQKLLSIGNDSKTVKGEARGYRTAILYLAPSNLSGRNVCSHATPGCIASCLNTAGRGSFNSVQQARIKRTHFFFRFPVTFMEQLFQEILTHANACQSAGMIPVVRLNRTSDIPWENKAVMGRTLFEWFSRRALLRLHEKPTTCGSIPSRRLAYQLSACAQSI